MWYVSRPPQNKGMSRISIRIRLGFTNFAECSLGFLPDFGRMWIPSYCPMDASHSTPTCFATFTLPETNIALEHRPNNKRESTIKSIFRVLEHGAYHQQFQGTILFHGRLDFHCFIQQLKILETSGVRWNSDCPLVSHLRTATKIFLDGLSAIKNNNTLIQVVVS